MVIRLIRFAMVGSGAITLTMANHLFDWSVYPLGIAFWGPLKGGVAMTILSLALNYTLIRAYNRTDRDWFGFEYLRRNKAIEPTTWGRKVIGFLARGGHWPLFIYLACRDPSKAFVFSRGRMPAGAGFGFADWRFFVAITLFSNVLLIAMITGALNALKWFY